MAGKITLGMIVVVIIAYFVGAKYPFIAQKVGFVS
jgi:hypothetical protein